MELDAKQLDRILVYLWDRNATWDSLDEEIYTILAEEHQDLALPQGRKMPQPEGEQSPSSSALPIFVDAPPFPSVSEVDDVPKSSKDGVATPQSGVGACKCGGDKHG